MIVDLHAMDPNDFSLEREKMISFQLSLCISWYMGASMVKYTASLSSTSLTESDLERYTNFKFCEGKFMNIFKTHRSTKPNNLCWQKKIQEKSTYARR